MHHIQNVLFFLSEKEYSFRPLKSIIFKLETLIHTYIHTYIHTLFGQVGWIRGSQRLMWTYCFHYITNYIKITRQKAI